MNFSLSWKSDIITAVKNGYMHTYHLYSFYLAKTARSPSALTTYVGSATASSFSYPARWSIPGGFAHFRGKREDFNGPTRRETYRSRP